MRIVVAMAAVALVGVPAGAAERLEGWFIAREACEAFQSKNKQTNPGEVTTEPMRAYAMLAINAPGGDFFQVTVPGAPVTEARWVHVGCGVHVVEAGTPVAPLPTEPVEPAPGAEAAEHVLALSWQPAFCETRPGKTECQQLNAGELPVTETQLSVHGLWPQPEGNFYCGVPAGLVALDKASQWADLPEPPLDDETREALAVAMPGTASFLERHEWIKHGTCHRGAGGADEYFDDTLALADAVNASEVAGFLATLSAPRSRPPSSAPASTPPSGRAPAIACRCIAPATAAARSFRRSRSRPAGSSRPGRAGRADPGRRPGLAGLPARRGRPGGLQ